MCTILWAEMLLKILIWGRGHFKPPRDIFFFFFFTILNVKLLIFQTNYISFPPEIKRRGALPIWRAVPQEVLLGRVVERPCPPHTTYNGILQPE